ncbi:uncharacterized protein FPOAC1_013193 [Fusarium poae]|nr:uncharacterized protein FPOAC1_013193 [Fusarium poae]KAG8665214.1 hypothetical protein FPOAC1_013193 [Fusarium poae]
MVGEIQVYDSRPLSGSVKGILILFPDGFGLASHNQLLADMFAERGWTTIIPDYFEGDAVPISVLERDQSRPLDEQFDLKLWLSRHPHESVERHAKDLYEHVHSSNDNLGIAVAGYCFGGKYALRASSWPGVHVALAFHPSFVERDDIAGAPVEPGCRTFVGLAENDEMVPKTLGADISCWAAEASRTITQRVFPHVGHGFAARPAATAKTEMEQFREAFEFACAALEGS